MGMLALQQQQWRWVGSSHPSSASHLLRTWRVPALFPSSRFRSLQRSPFQCLLQVDTGGSPAQGDPLHRIVGERLPPPSLGLLPTKFYGAPRNCVGKSPFSSLPKVLPLVRLLLLGIGALFALQLPALADLGGQGSTATVLHGAKVSEIITSGWAGLMAGCLHTLTGPDHLAALAPLCIGRAKLESAIVGALWGCGHDAGQIIFGLFFLLLKGKLKIELLQVWASRVVGITLLAIGAVGLKEAQEVPVSVLAAEGPPVSTEVVEDKKTTHRLRTFAAGIVYGLQPDALIVILPALALPSRIAGASYLGMFLLGTVVAMGSYTAFIGSCGQALQSRLPWITRRLTIGSSVVAIIFGLSVLLGELFGINFFH